MKGTYLFAFIAALVVVLGGIFLLSRDGTENVTDTTLITTPEPQTESLPINTATNTDDFVGDPILEEGDASTTAGVFDLPETSEEEVDVGIVTYSNTGFSPKTITIEQGDAVTFVNNSSRNMWVASNIHPTHNEYPEESDEDCLGSSFDACTGIKSGESWTFTFGRIGEWGYHDHLNPSRTGTIVVE